MSWECMPDWLCRPSGSTSFRAQVRGLICLKLVGVKSLQMAIEANYLHCGHFSFDIVNINLATLILETMDQCDITLWCLIQIKTIRSVLIVSTYMITSITASPIRLNCDTWSWTSKLQLLYIQWNLHMQSPLLSSHLY